MVDNITTTKASTKLFSKLSISFSALTFVLFVFLFNSVPTTIKVNEGLPVIPKWLIAITEISCLLGLIFTIISLVKKERFKYWKAIGAVLNILFFLLLVGVVSFAFLMDSKKEH